MVLDARSSMVQQSSSVLGYGLLEATNACYRKVPRFLMKLEWVD